MATTLTYLPFALPDIGDDEIDEVVDSMRSGWLTTGPKARRFEQDFAEFFGGDVEALAVNSATSGLHLALEALGICSEDEVITTPYTFTATAEVVRYFNANPVFADIDPHTLNIDPSAIESAITPRTKAIIPVHFGGLACDMDSILDIAHRYNLRVVEDAAHALPTTSGSRLVGSLQSDATVFSFYVTKPLTTGEGGMVVTRNPEIAARCRVMRLHGIDRDAFERYVSNRPAWYYEVVGPGFKYNMTDIAASIGIHQLRKAYQLQRRRGEIAHEYTRSFAGLPLVLPPQPNPGELHAWHLYVIRLTDDARVDRNRFIEMMADMGISTSVHFIPLTMQPYWRDTYGLRERDYPNVMDCYRRTVSLPIYTRMTDEDVQRVVGAIRSILE
ncbi:MAG: DegT/DnrJ/EryC1/StrS aminotransferase family protein [Armatimonadota bacterium]